MDHHFLVISPPICFTEVPYLFVQPISFIYLFIFLFFSFQPVARIAAIAISSRHCHNAISLVSPVFGEEVPVLLPPEDPPYPPPLYELPPFPGAGVAVGSFSSETGVAVGVFSGFGVTV